MDVNDYLQRGYNCEVHALQKRINELEELLQSATCIYCGENFNKDSDLAAHIHACESHPLGKAIAERDLYKPYYDAIIDMAVVNWTLDGLSQKDAHHAIQRLVIQHAQEACDPQLNEELAKLKDRAESAERALALSEQVRSISVRADAYEQKCRQLDAAIKRAEAAETRLSSVLDRVGFEVSDRCYCDELDGDKCDACEFLRDLRRFAEGRADE